MKFLLLILIFTAQYVVAGEKEFLDLCHRFDELSSQEKTTMRSLIKIGSGMFTTDVNSCEDVLVQLKKTKHLEMTGQTFAYIDVDSLEPITTLDWIESLTIERQFLVTDITTLQKMKLKSLNIRGTGVEDYAQLNRLSSLESLIISVSDQKNLEKLFKLKWLKDLDIRIHDFGEIDFNTLPLLLNLQSLNVWGISQNRLPIKLKNLSALSNLKKLTVRRGSIDASNLSSLQLKSLFLDNNELVKISSMEEIGSIESLEELTLSRQNITDISFLKNLENLSQLNLSYNKITSAKEVSNLISLEKLDMSFNEIWQDADFKKLVNLKSLNLYTNRLGFFNAVTLKNLKSLNLGYNNLHRVTFDTHLFLEKVTLSDNQLRSRLIQTITQQSLPVIKDLDLSSNKLTTLKEIGTLSTLETLEINDNKITSIDELSGLKNLKTMSARYNLLTVEDQVCPVSRKRVCDFLHQEI